MKKGKSGQYHHQQAKTVKLINHINKCIKACTTFSSFFFPPSLSKQWMWALMLSVNCNSNKYNNVFTFSFLNPLHTSIMLHRQLLEWSRPSRKDHCLLLRSLRVYQMIPWSVSYNRQSWRKNILQQLNQQVKWKKNKKSKIKSRQTITDSCSHIGCEEEINLIPKLIPK